MPLSYVYIKKKKFFFLSPGGCHDFGGLLKLSITGHSSRRETVVDIFFSFVFKPFAVRSTASSPRVVILL